MARKEDRQKALKMRKEGRSYSYIKEVLSVSKGTLSGWLSEFPLSKEQMVQLRDRNPKRIERFRNTMREKREVKNMLAYKTIAKRIGKINDRELFISGFFLYWGEGSKTRTSSIELTNTNPYMLKFFIRWLELFGIPRSALRVRLHIYADMDMQKQMQYWSKILSIPIVQFRKPYIKKTMFTSITYTNGFGQGTCSVLVSNTEISREVLMGIQYIQNMVKRKSDT